MKEIIIKQGNKTTFKFVPEDYQPTDDIAEGDLTTSGRSSIGYNDISKERWKEIFGDKNKCLISK